MLSYSKKIKVMNMEKAEMKTNFTPFALMPLALVCEATKLSEDELYNLVRDGKFPKSIYPQPHILSWSGEDVKKWLEQNKRNEE